MDKSEFVTKSAGFKLRFHVKISLILPVKPLQIKQPVERPQQILATYGPITH